MLRHLTRFTLGIVFIAAIWAAQTARAADAVVGAGFPASCTEAAFDAALSTASNGGGTITFDCGPNPHTIQLSLVKIVNLGSVSIDGGGLITLQAGPNERLFFAGPVTFHLSNITLQGGDALVNGGAIEASGAQVILENVQILDNRSTVSGGAIYCYAGTLTIRDSLIEGNEAETGGAIYNDGCTLEFSGADFIGNQATGVAGRGGAVENAAPGTLAASDTRFEDNYALDGGGLYNASGASAALSAVTFTDNTAGYGGGVENSGALTVTNSLFDGNEVTGSGGGLWNLGGTAIIERTTFADNFAYEGGGVNSYGALLEMSDVNLTGNYANGFSGAPNGGGLYHAGGAAFITNATIQGNFAANNGGGIYQASDDNLTLTNVTIAGNVAAGLGGGLYHYGRYAVLSNVTLADNLAGLAGHAIYEDSPQTPASPGVAQLVNTVLAGTGNLCDGGLFMSLGHNLSQGSCASLTDPSDYENYPGDLLLASLADNGGAHPMQTMSPLAGSPLIDAADASYCPPADQRGVARPQGAGCDIGALEYTAAPQRIYLPMIQR